MIPTSNCSVHGQTDPVDVVHRTSTLFGDLWHRYNDQLFRESVELFAQRFEANGFDLSWFQDKTCLDAGCGGGRYSIALGLLGAKSVTGCDISDSGLADAQLRAAPLPHVKFVQSSVLKLPFADSTFDFVCCSGVLHHTSDPEQGLRELTRVLRPAGRLYLLLYGQGGLRWPAIMSVRPFAQAMGYTLVDEALQLAGLPANKQRTFLDDLFVPLIKFYTWEEVRGLLAANKYTHVERWTQGKLDHETSVPVQRTELVQLRSMFETALHQTRAEFPAAAKQAAAAIAQLTSTINRLDATQAEFSAGRIDQRQRDWEVFGWGHHRVLAQKV